MSLPNASEPAVRPKAETFKVSDLMSLVQRGRIRIPPFQRPYRWSASDRLLLLDSIWRGYPAGMLLLWKHEAPAQMVRLGPLSLTVPASHDALWVVDGQQRLSTLAACLLLRPEHPAFRTFATYFDLEKGEFVGHSSAGREGPRWLPTHRAFDPNDSQEWALDHLRDPDRRRLAFRVGSALRDFEIPAITVESNEDRELRQIFDRVNTAGRKLRRDEVFRALHEGFGGGSPDTTASVARELSELGRGTLGTTWIQRTAEVLAGIDPTRKRTATDRDPGAHSEILRTTVDPLRRVLDFLVEDARIPRMELVPHHLTLPILARFFQRFPEPHERNRALLSRWLWRGALSGAHATNSSPLTRAMIRAANAKTESEAVQQLLALVPRSPPASPPTVAAPVRGLHAAARVAINAFMASQPLTFEDDARPFDLAFLLAAADDGASERVDDDPSRPLATGLIQQPRIVAESASRDVLGAASVANLLLVRGDQTKVTGARRTVDLPWLAQQSQAIASSHGFIPQICEAIAGGATAELILTLRLTELEARAKRFWSERTRWDDPDRDRAPLSALESEGEADS